MQKLRKSRRDEAKRIDAKIKLQRMFRKKYSSNSLVLVETVLPGNKTEEATTAAAEESGADKPNRDYLTKVKEDDPSSKIGTSFEV